MTIQRYTVNENEFEKGGIGSGRKKGPKKQEDIFISEYTPDGLMDIDMGAFEKIGATSGGQVRENPEMRAKYIQHVKETIGEPKQQFNAEIHDQLEDENFHLLNETLANEGYYPENIARGYKNLNY